MRSTSRRGAFRGEPMNRREERRLLRAAEEALAGGDSNRALACFDRSFRARRPIGRPLAGELASVAKLRHDIEQLELLVARGRLSDRALERLEALRFVELSLGEGAAPGAKRHLQPFGVSPALRRLLGPAYDRRVHGTWPTAMRGRVLNRIDADRAADDYRSGEGLVVLDDLLTPRALAALRRHCVESTIWYHVRPNGYLCAYLHDGFACGLVLQIADELRARLPALLGTTPLLTAWGYKYDHAYGGLGLHADRALVNVNLWLTPDAANLDAASGGLVVHHARVPDRWSFDDYNRTGSVTKMRRWLRARNARVTHLPHRQNRAVVFDSAFLHESDRCVFAPGYENRRVNVTFLFGSRQRSR